MARNKHEISTVLTQGMYADSYGSIGGGKKLYRSEGFFLPLHRKLCVSTFE